jgi:hypothetical protein
MSAVIRMKARRLRIYSRNSYYLASLIGKKAVSAQGEINASSGFHFRITEFAALVGMLLVVTLRSLAQEDLTFWDETAYLHRGLLTRRGIWPAFVEGATYSDVYSLISFWVRNPVDLYFAGRVLAAVSLVAAIYISARLFSDSRTAFTASALMAVTPAPYVWPGVASPASALLLVGIALIIRFQDPLYFGVSSGLFWLAAGSRPEFLWFAVTSSCVSMGWTSLLVIRSKIRNVRTLGTILSLVCGGILTPVVLARMHGSPFDSGEREWVAFGQHFSLRRALPTEDPWMDWSTIVNRNFPDANGMFEALVSNPQRFLNHVGSNVTDLPGALTNFVTRSWLSGWPENLPPGALMFASLLIGIIISLCKSSNSVLKKLRSWRQLLFCQRKKPLCLFVFLALGFAMMPPIVIFPREHYLLVGFSFAILALVLLQRAIATTRLELLVPCVVVCILWGLFSFRTCEELVSRLSAPTSLAANAKQLNEIGGDWQLLGVDWGLEVYVDKLTQVSDSKVNPSEPFATYLLHNHINLILFNERFMNGPWSRTKGFIEFVENPGDFGFRQLSPRSLLWIRMSEFQLIGSHSIQTRSL